MCIRDSTGCVQERTTVLDVRLDRVARRDAARLQWSAGALVCPGAVAKGFQKGRFDLDRVSISALRLAREVHLRQVDGKRPTHLGAGIGSWPAAVEAAGMSRHANRRPGEAFPNPVYGQSRQAGDSLIILCGTDRVRDGLITTTIHGQPTVAVSAIKSQ